MMLCLAPACCVSQFQSTFLCAGTGTSGDPPGRIKRHCDSGTLRLVCSCRILSTGCSGNRRIGSFCRRQGHRCASVTGTAMAEGDNGVVCDHGCLCDTDSSSLFPLAARRLDRFISYVPGWIVWILEQLACKSSQAEDCLRESDAGYSTKRAGRLCYIAEGD